MKKPSSQALRVSRTTLLLLIMFAISSALLLPLIEVGTSAAFELAHSLVPSGALARPETVEQSVRQSQLNAPEESVKTKIADQYGKLPLRFEANEGQTDEQVKFLSRGPGYDLFLTASGAMLSLRKPQSQRLDKVGAPPLFKDDSSLSATAVVLRLKMIGANLGALVDGQDELPGKVNYLIGNDPGKSHANIPTYRRVHYTEVYPGVDMVYYGNQQQLEYDFVLAPGADLRAVKFRVEGAQHLRLERTGDLGITVDRSEVKLRKPVIYQITGQGERKEVIGSYALKGTEVSFNVRNYDQRKPLIIDPILSYSTYFGPAANALAIAVDASGNAYLTGSATSAIFPTTPGSFKPTNTQGGTDAFVTKLNSTGTALIYSTFLGGSGTDVGRAIAVDSSGNAFLTGETTSSDFPTLNAIRSSTSNFLTTSDAGGHWSGRFIGPPNGLVNVLVVDPLTPSTIYAGMGLDGGGGIYKTTDGGINWVALNTGLSNDNCPALVIDPATPSTLYASLNPNNSPGSGLYKSVDAGTTWTMLTNGLSGVTVSALAIDPSSPSTLYAGTAFSGLYKSTNGGASWTNSSTGINFGGINAIAVDLANSATVYASAGGGGVFKTTNGGGNWTQVNTGLTNTIIRTLKIDSASNVYAGSVGGGLFKSTNGGGNWSPLNNGLPTFTSVTSLAFNSSATTIFLGTPDGHIYKSVDSGANWAITYETLTRTSFNSLVMSPTSSSVLYAGAGTRSDPLNDYEAFVVKLNPNGSALVYSTYLGGNKDDFGRGIAVDSAGNAYVAGQTASAIFPLAAAFQSTLKGTADAFVTKFNVSGDALVYSTFLGGDGFETANGIATDGGGNAYVTGSTSSANFPLANPFQASLAETFFGADAFVTKFSSTGALAYSTYLGGNSDDSGSGIAVDSSGNAYVTGASNSSNFPTANPIESTNLGGFVTKLNNLGSGLIYSTYFGNGRGIAVDSTGSAYLTGFTNAAAFPLVAGSLRTKSPFFTSTNGGGSWSNDNYGLKSDIVTALALDPTNPSIIYAGTRSGAFKTIDGGRNWNAINAGLVGPNVVALVVDPVTTTTVYLAARFSDSGNSNGVFKSTNGGINWNPVNNGLGNGGVLSLASNPVTPSTLYAGSGGGGGVFKSTNGGGSWTTVGQSLFFIDAIVIDPTTPTTIYAGGDGGGVFKSIDGGANWQPINNGLTDTSVVSLAVDPITPSTIYAGARGGLFKSVNGGNNWTAINNGLSGRFISAIAIDPVTPSTIYVTSSSLIGGVSKSTDGGNSWISLAGAGPRSSFVSAVKVNPVNPSKIYIGAQNSPFDNDAFVTKINPSGTAFVYSTLLGGSANPFDGSGFSDEAHGIAVDPSGNAYVTGSTREPDFPTTPDSYLPIPVGGSFVSKLTMSYLISGQVTDAGSAPVAGAEVVLSDGATLRSFLTEADGTYQFSQLREGGNFTVSATKPNFTLSPASYSFSNLIANQTANFTATTTNSPFYTISGQVTNNGAALSGVTITLSGSQPGVRITDSNGNYSFTLAGGGNYTLTPSILGFTLSPPSQTFNNLSANQTANFAVNRQSFVVTNANNHGTGSLRQAMLDANATAGLDTIVFSIPGSGVKTINLQIALPEITDPVVIDATTEPGYAGTPLVELNGTAVGTNNAGFWISAGGSTIRGFVMNRFSNPGFGAIYIRTNGSNVIQANYIGLNSNGTLRSSNYGGIIISDSSNNLIGGTTPAARNVISGSAFEGIIVNGSNNQIMGNFIGTNAAGTAGVGNGISGIVVTGSVPATGNNVIGGTTPGAGNLISGNQRGIDNASSTTLIQGNLIGTDVSGTQAVGNSTGIQSTSPNTVIGGTLPGARNIISGNIGDGVVFGGSGSRLEGNFIGTDITGTVALGNLGSGVVAGNALIGGTTPEARNVISGNGGFGNISLGSNNSAAQATVQGNYIGTDVTGNVALTNPQAGISISGSNHLVGGLLPGTQNVISGNRVGIQIAGSVGNVVQGNLIGLNALGTAPLANSQAGISIFNSLNNTIGGTQPGAANKISFNRAQGIIVSSGTGNSIVGNSIFSNLLLGVDLGAAGITANDSGDADNGANNLQNFPLLTSVTPNVSTTNIQGTINSRPSTALRIDFYSNAACDSLGNGEGARFFDTTNVTTDAGGNASFNVASSVVLAAGRVITATATDPAGNTSEFSSCDSTNATGHVQFKVATPKALEDVGNALIEVVRSGGSKGALSVNYTTADGTATAGSDYTAVSGTLVFAEGETTKIIGIPIVNDSVSEPDETLRLDFSAADLDILGPQAATTLTIQDSSTPLVLSMNSVDVVEGNSGTKNAVITVTLSAGTGRMITANFSTVAGSATSGSDFTPVSGTLGMSSGVTTQTITVPIVGDALNEAIETFQVVLSNPANATVGNAALVRILDDDPLPAVSISDASVTERNNGIVNIVFNISLSTPSGRLVSLSLNTTNGTATAGSDFVGTSGTQVSINPGETLTTGSIAVNGDSLIEPDETFFVNIIGQANATVARGQAVGTILNDDPSVQFSAATFSVVEDGGSANITITRTDGTGTAGVLFATSNGTATSADYTPVSQTVTFNSGELSKTVNVQITNDTMGEANETINLTLSNVTGPFFLGAPSSAVLTINDDELPAVIRFSSGFYNVAEGAGSTTITVERSGNTSQAVTVDYASSDHSNPADFLPCTSPGAGFASSRCDFTTAIGTLRFAAGETSKTFNVLISQDNYVEGPETLELTLSNLFPGTVFGVPQTATLSITDDATEPATNYVDVSSEFVRSQYHDFLNREPDAPGLAFWTDNIEKCNDAFRRPPGQTVAQCIDKQRESTAVAFFMSPEFQITGGFVYHLYKGSLTGSPNYDGGSPGRFPTSLEFMRDLATVSEGIVVNNAISGAVVEANRNRLAAEFVLRPEFVAKYGGLNDTLYVQGLLNTTGIAATAAEKQALVNGLSGGTETRASVLRKVVDGTVVISESNVQFTTPYGQAFINQENQRVFVFMEYVGYLRRNPDTPGYVFWLGKLNFYGGDPFRAEMVRSFILAPEYRQRFGQ